MSDVPKGFVPLRSLAKGPPEPAKAREEIRAIYFKTSKKTIDADFDHAIELLKNLPEEERDKVAVYMEGLAEMRKQWAVVSRQSAGRPRRNKS